MSQRMVVRGGRVVDGSGLPGYTADVEMRDGRITAVGRVSTAGAQVLDADGLVVAPGFIDVHTHYDAQLHFEPTARRRRWARVPTVIVGNWDSHRAAQARDVPLLLRQLVGRRSCRDSLSAGVPFAGGRWAIPRRARGPFGATWRRCGPRRSVVRDGATHHNVARPATISPRWARSFLVAG